MRRVRHFGYAQNGPGREADVLSCAHCQFQIFVQPPKGKDSVRIDRCGQCDAAVCPKCADELVRTLKCAPFQKRLETIESRARLRAALDGG